MFETFLKPETYIALATLTGLEIVLGIDNIIFISILASKLPPPESDRARQVGLVLALFIRLALLFSISWLASLSKPLLQLLPLQVSLSGRDLVLLFGGLFLLWKSSMEIYEKVEHVDGPEKQEKGKVHSFQSIILQIILIDAVFSLDSIITAVGMVNDLPVMTLAIIISVLFMLFASAAVSSFIEKHPSIKILALSFLTMIGTMLVAEAFHYEIPRGYIYFAFLYSLAVEMFNIRRNKKQEMG